MKGLNITERGAMLIAAVPSTGFLIIGAGALNAVLGGPQITAAAMALAGTLLVIAPAIMAAGDALRRTWDTIQGKPGRGRVYNAVMAGYSIPLTLLIPTAAAGQWAGIIETEASPALLLAGAAACAVTALISTWKLRKEIQEARTGTG